MKPTEDHHIVTYTSYNQPNASCKLSHGDRVLGWWFGDRLQKMKVSRQISYRVEFCHQQQRPA